MNASPIPDLIAELRLLVGYLGEKEQFNWWGSGFMAATSESFLSPIFPRSTWLARYHGVSGAARIIHDERIGVGLNYHLFRLPDSQEISAAAVVEAVVEATSLQELIKSPVAALERLEQLAGSYSEGAEGPVSVGEIQEDSLGMPFADIARYYCTAFQTGIQSFPFVRGRQ